MMPNRHIIHRISHPIYQSMEFKRPAVWIELEESGIRSHEEQVPDGPSMNHDNYVCIVHEFDLVIETELLKILDSRSIIVNSSNRIFKLTNVSNATGGSSLNNKNVWNMSVSGVPWYHSYSIQQELSEFSDSFGIGVPPTGAVEIMSTRVIAPCDKVFHQIGLP